MTHASHYFRPWHKYAGSRLGSVAIQGMLYGILGLIYNDFATLYAGGGFGGKNDIFYSSLVSARAMA